MVEHNDDKMEIQALIEDLNNLLNKQEKRGNNVAPKKLQRFYAVARGHKIGVFLEWDGPNGAKRHVEGYPNNWHKRFSSLDEALDFIETNRE